MSKNKKEQNINVKYKDQGQLINVSDIKPERTYTDVELFAGGGGLALGLEQAGFKNVMCIESDLNPVKTLQLNRPDWNVIRKDIRKVDSFRKLLLNSNQEIDLLSGGYPCNSFSYIGKRLGLKDTRGTLFYEYARALKELQPKMFLVENVKGLVTMDHGQTLNTMIKVFEDIGYKVRFRVLNAWNYGVPEKRVRMIMVGIRNDLDISFSYPKEHDYKPVLRDELKDVPDSVGATYSKAKADVLKLVPEGGNWKNLPVAVAKAYMGKSYYSGGGKTGIARRLAWNEPSLTLTTSPSQKQTERCHPTETRPLTTREYARIQAFPDNWQFAGGVTSIYKQIGNAVPVNLAKDVGLAIINTLDQLYL